MGTPGLAIIVGLCAATLTAVASWVPSLWGDEVASITSATRTWPSLIRLLEHLDVVHGAYYALLKLWVEVFGTSAFAVRLPSAIAIGFAAAGIVLLIRHAAGMYGTVFAAVTFTFLPRIGYIGIDARSTALATAAAVWLTVLASRLLRGRSATGWWLLYVIAVAASLYLYVYLVFILLVHVTLVIASRVDKRARRRWYAAWVAALGLAVPILWTAYAQREQIAYLARGGLPAPAAYLVAQWFSHYYYAIPAWGLILAGIVCGVRRCRGRLPGGGALSRRTLVITAVVWLILPTAVLLIFAATGHGGYAERYVAFCAPAAAILMSFGTKALPQRRVWLAAALAAILVLSLPTWISHRTPYANNGGTDWKAVAALIQQDKRPGDGILFDETTTRADRPRLATYAYPAAFAGIADPELLVPLRARAKLLDKTVPLANRPSALDGIDRMWVVDRSPDRSIGDVQTLRHHGFVLVFTQRLDADTVRLYVREPEAEHSSVPGE